MSMVCFNVYSWPNWKRRLGLYLVRTKGMWAFGFRVYSFGLEINNNNVWTLTERTK